jgi:hypothetical protein
MSPSRSCGRLLRRCLLTARAVTTTLPRMATKKETAILRGAKLMKKALVSAKETIIASPEPLPGAKKLVLPNGEPISPAMKELLAFDGEWLGIGYDEDEHEVEAMSLDEVVEEHFGEEAVAAFGEASELFSGDCVFFAAETTVPACLYVGEADDDGEYPVLQLTFTDGVAKIGGFIPFDVWAAQELGALERGKGIGDVPAAYEALLKPIADTNGDGRLVFTSKAGEGSDDEDEDEDEDEDKEEKDSDED